MTDTGQARLETLHRVRDRLSVIYRRVYEPVNRALVDEYHHELDRLKNVGEDVDEFYVRESDW